MGVVVDGVDVSSLRCEVEEALFAEADLLDERRFEEWLDFLADDVRYVMPLRLNVRFGEQAEREDTRADTEVCWFDDSKASLEMRVRQIMSGVHWAEEPFSRVSHMVTNVRIVRVSLPEVEVSSRFLVYRNRVAAETDFFVGRRLDRLRNVDGRWLLCRRDLVLEQNVLLAKNLTLFL